MTAASAELFDEVAYLFDGTAEGLFSAIFASYSNRQEPSEVVREADYQPRLLQQALFIPTSEEHAQRVAAGLKRRLGSYGKWAVLRATCSGRQDAPTIIYRFVRYAMDRAPQRKRLLDDLGTPEVKALHDLITSVGAECEKMRQFARFQHLKDERGEVWFARVNPRDSVVPLVMGHFVERFSIQPFILYDEGHGVAGIWDGRHQQLAYVSEPDLTLPNQSASEVLMEEAWRTFYHSVSISSRYNPELRRRLMPKRFWKNLTEMQESAPQALRHG